MIDSNRIIGTMHTPAFPVIRGADIVARTTVEFTPDQPLNFHWEGHGFKVHIPAGAIRRERGRVTLCIQASLSGDYQLPDDGVLVSGVYWLSLHPNVERFDKKVTISLQHCASDSDDSILSFITAKCTQETLPYSFNPLPGGAFSDIESTIQVDNFSAFSVVKQIQGIINYIYGTKFYAFRVFYIPKQQPNEYEVHITVTENLELCQEVQNNGEYCVLCLVFIVHVQNTLKADTFLIFNPISQQKVKSEYREWETGLSFTRKIQESMVSLRIPTDPWEEDNWELSSLTPHAVRLGNFDDNKCGFTKCRWRRKSLTTISQKE